jgi:hypothetical protein
VAILNNSIGAVKFLMNKVDVTRLLIISYKDIQLIFPKHPVQNINKKIKFMGLMKDNLVSLRPSDYSFLLEYHDISTLLYQQVDLQKEIGLPKASSPMYFGIQEEPLLNNTQEENDLRPRSW